MQEPGVSIQERGKRRKAECSKLRVNGKRRDEGDKSEKPAFDATTL